MVLSSTNKSQVGTGLVTKLRAMTRADIPAVVVIEQSVQASPWTESRIMGSFADHGCQVLVELDAQNKQENIIGYAVAYAVLDEWHLLNIAVAKLYQNRGLGKEFLAELISQAGEQGARIFMLEVRASNLPAIKLYERLGFEKVGVRPDYYPGNSQPGNSQSASPGANAESDREDAWLFSLRI